MNEDFTQKRKHDRGSEILPPLSNDISHGNGEGGDFTRQVPMSSCSESLLMQLDSCIRFKNLCWVDDLRVQIWLSQLFLFFCYTCKFSLISDNCETVLIYVTKTVSLQL